MFICVTVKIIINSAHAAPSAQRMSIYIIRATVNDGALPPSCGVGIELQHSEFVKLKRFIDFC